MPASVLAALLDPRVYDAKLVELERRWRAKHRLDRVRSGGVSLNELGARAPALVRAVVRSVRRDEYVFEPLREVEALVDDKRRTLYVPSLTDALVLGVLADLLAQLISPALSPRVYSYQRGRSAWEAIRHLRTYLAGHRAHLPVHRRGLHGIHRDITRYGESIRTDPGAPLWAQLERLLAPARGTAAARVFDRLLRAAIRPEVVDPSGEVRVLERGLATGAAIQPALCNLHLTDLDRALEQLDGAFFARFGDDVLLLHPEAEVVQRAASIVDRELARLDLIPSVNKRDDFYLTGCGRSSARWPEARHDTHLEWLGARVSFAGDVGLKRKKSRRLLSQLRRRLGNAARLLEGAPKAERARVLCAVANDALEPEGPLALAAAQLVRHVLDDRRQLRELDYLIALTLAGLVTGRRGPRAFREAPPRWLRAQGLVSLLALRNAVKGARQTGAPAPPDAEGDTLESAEEAES